MLSVLLAGAVIILGQLGLPAGTARFGPADVTDSYAEIHLSTAPLKKLVGSTEHQGQHQRLAAADATEFVAPNRAVEGTPRLNPNAEPRHRMAPPAAAFHDPEALNTQTDRRSPAGGSGGKADSARRAQRRPPERSTSQRAVDAGAVRRGTRGPARNVASDKPKPMSRSEAKRAARAPDKAKSVSRSDAKRAAVASEKSKPVSRSDAKRAAHRTADSAPRARARAQRNPTSAAPAVQRDRKPAGRAIAAKGRSKR